MANTVANLTAVLQMNNTKFKKGLSSSQKAMNAFKSQVKQLGGMITGAFAIGSIVNFTRQAIQLSTQAEGIKVAFQNLNDPTLLDGLKTATRGTVNELELMKAAVRASNFKVPLDQLATFFDFATSRAIQTGESVDYLVNSIIDGIGRKSTLVMDNLGISATELQDEIKKVGDFGQAAANIIQREMAKAGTVLDTTATSLARATAKWEDFKVVAGEGALKSFGFLSDMLMATFNPALYASEQAIRDMNDALYESQSLVRGIAEMDKRFGKMKSLKSEMRADSDAKKKASIAAGNKGPSHPMFWGPGFEGYLNLPSAPKTQKDWGDRNPLDVAGNKLYELDQAWKMLDETLNEYGNDLEEIMDDPETSAKIEEWNGLTEKQKKAAEALYAVKKSTHNLSNDVAILTSGFMSLGVAIAQIAKGAEQSFDDMAQTLMATVGQVLISIGGWAAVAGIILQGGSAIWDALESPGASTPGGSSNWGTASVQFKIEGRDLVGAINNENSYRNIAT